MAEQWEARGPDDFGDFTISAQGEQLAKCVVVQNGFRSYEETKTIAERLIKAVNNHEALVKALDQLDTLLDFGDENLDSVWTFDDLTAIQAAFNDAKAILDAVGGSRE